MQLVLGHGVDCSLPEDIEHHIDMARGNNSALNLYSMVLLVLVSKAIQSKHNFSRRIPDYHSVRHTLVTIRISINPDP